MFTPSRKKTSGLPSSRKSQITPHGRNVSRTSLLRRSLAPRNSMNTSNISFSSPTVTSSFAPTHHKMEAYQSSIPVFVSETISLADDISEISVQIGDNGWSWLVCGQKLFIWTHQQNDNASGTICKELSLRSVAEDDYYSADLVAILDVSGNISVLAVSLLGQMLYWSNVLISTAPSYEAFVGLQGVTEQCFNVKALQGQGFLLCSSSGQLHHIYASKQSLSCKQVSKSAGAGLAGISRRVSSFFFASASVDNNVLQMNLTPTRKMGEFELLMLTSSVLQHWGAVFNSDISNVNLIAEVDLHQAVSGKLSTLIWNDQKPNAKLWPLDSRHTSRSALVLVAMAETADAEATLYYAVCVFMDLNKPDDVNIILLEHQNTYSKSNENEVLSYELVLSNPLARSLKHFAVWASDKVILKTIISTDGESEEDCIPFNGVVDRVLGAGSCNGQCLFLSAVYGLLTTSPVNESRMPSALEGSILGTIESPPSNRRSLQSLPGTPVFSQSKMDQLESSENSAKRLQAAFLHYCRLNTEQAETLVAESFKPGGTLLDNAVVVVSGNLLDDYPAQDPRWAESVPQDATTDSTGSLILLYQLEDKQKAHSLFLKFLADVGIWNRLTVFTSGREKIVTQWLLWEHAEKLCACISLLQKHSSHQVIVDAAIRRVLNQRDNLMNIGGLTPRDYFYRDVSRVDEVFEHLIEEEEKTLMKSTLSSRERATVVASVNSVFEAMLMSVRQYRKSHEAHAFDENKLEYVPWTVGSGRSNIRNMLMQQHKITFERGLPETEDAQQRALLCQSLVTIADLVLEGYQEQSSSLSPQEVARKSEVDAVYGRHKSQLISPLVKIGQIEKAQLLAEKYHDFDTLVQICNDSEDMEKIGKYMIKFSDQGFAEYLFRWYLERREYRKLLSCCHDDNQKQKLAAFLQAHPNLAWMLQVKTGDYTSAHNTLRDLASSEKELASKKRNYLSLSKLAAVFSDQTDDELKENLEDIYRERTLLKYQETLPSVMLESLQQNLDTMPVYPPSRLIQLYTVDVNEDSNEVDFKKAFELLQFLPCESDETVNEADEMKLRIWCLLILKDSWRDVDMTLDPLDSCSHTILVRTLMLAQSSEMLQEILPNVHALLRRSELRDLRSDASFEYTIRACFEGAQRTLQEAAA